MVSTQLRHTAAFNNAVQLIAHLQPLGQVVLLLYNALLAHSVYNALFAHSIYLAYFTLLIYLIVFA